MLFRYTDVSNEGKEEKEGTIFYKKKLKVINYQILKLVHYPVKLKSSMILRYAKIVQRISIFYQNDVSYCALVISAGPDLVRVRTSENGINLSSPDKDGFKCHSKQLPSVLTSKTDDSDYDDDDDGGHQQHQQRESNFVCLCQSGRMINHA